MVKRSPDGTRQSAGAVKRVPVALDREETATERWMRALRPSGFGLVLIVLLVIAVAVLAPGLRVLLEQQQQIAALEREVEMRQKQVADLQQQLDRWTDPAYVVAQARQRLLFAYPGESSYLVIGEDQAPADSTVVVSSELVTTKVNWLQALLSSSWAAGLTTAPAEDLTVIGGDR